MENVTVENKRFIRSILSNIRAFLSIVLIIAIGVGFFISLKTILHQYESTTERYFEEQNLADYTLLGVDFDQNDVESIDQLESVEAIIGRVNVDVKRNETVLRVLSLPQDGDVTVNIPYLYEGTMPVSNEEILISNKYAYEHDLSIGDQVEIFYANDFFALVISGIIASPEYVYLAQSASMPMVDPYDFGIMFVNEGFFFQEGEPTYNEFIIKFSEGVDEEVAIEEVHQRLEKTIIQATKKENQTGYMMYKEDLDQINTFAYIFPIVFLLISSTMIYVLQKRNVVKERKQIGILKALGYSDLKIIQSYIKNGFFLSLFGSLLGYFIAYLFGDYILTVFHNMFEVPNLSLKVLPHLWTIGFFIAFIVCIAASIISVTHIIKISPAEAMHAEIPEDGKRIFLEKFPKLWSKLSFNSRYALKTALRNKGRFFTVLIGMAATITLTLFSLGLADSFNDLIDYHYDHVVNYDYLAETPLMRLEEEIRTDNELTVTKALIVPIKIATEETELLVPLLLVEEDFPFLNLRNREGNEIEVKDGVVITSYHANELNVGIGDYIVIRSYDETDEYRVEISDISHQGAGFYLYSTYDYISKVDNINVNVYNHLFVRSDLSEQELLKHDVILNVDSIEHEKETLLKLMEVVNVFTIVLVSFSIVLGITVLYSVSTINLAARNYEFTVLNVLGYNTKDILIAYVKETLLQLILAIPLGIVGAYFILHSIKEEFTNDAFMMEPFIAQRSFSIAAIIMISVITL